MIIKVKPRDLRIGDVFVDNGHAYWKVIAEPFKVAGDATAVKVQHIPDGGRELRSWISEDIELTVERENS